MWMLGILIGLVLGFIIAYLYFNLKLKGSDDRSGEVQSLLTEKAEISGELNHIKQQFQASKERIESDAQKLEKLYKENAGYQTTIQHLEASIGQQEENVDRLQKQLSLHFENVANKILEEKSQSFKAQNKEQLDTVLKPFSEKIRAFEDTVHKTQIESAKERNSLSEHIKQLTQLNNQMLEDAQNLTKALKGDNKAQGNWGEFILERVLEQSGLREGAEYFTQHTDTNIDGSTVRPDVVIKLTDNKHLIIDSKVSLLAYEKYVSSEDEEFRSRALKAHIDSVKAHIKLLSDKNYHTSTGLNSPEFVLLFIPIESSFSLTVQQDQDIYGYAWERNVVIVSPSTLLATLRAVSSAWKQERQTKNAIEIARQAGKLYDKFVGFLSDMEAIKNRLDQAKSSYEGAINKLQTGSGNLINSTQKLKKLGAKASKSIPETFLENTENELNEGSE